MTWSSAPASSTDGADAFDADFASGDRLHNDEQIRRIVQARQWGPDRQHCRTLTLPGYKGKVKYAQFLHDDSELKIKPVNSSSENLVLEMPEKKPEYDIPVIELVLQ